LCNISGDSVVNSCAHPHIHAHVHTDTWTHIHTWNTYTTHTHTHTYWYLTQTLTHKHDTHHPHIPAQRKSLKNKYLTQHTLHYYINTNTYLSYKHNYDIFVTFTTYTTTHGHKYDTHPSNAHNTNMIANNLQNTLKLHHKNNKKKLATKQQNRKYNSWSYT